MNHPILDIVLFAVLSWVSNYVMQSLAARGLLPQPKAPPQRFPWTISVRRKGAPDQDVQVATIPRTKGTFLLWPLTSTDPIRLRAVRVVINSQDPADSNPPQLAAIVYAEESTE